MSFMKPEIVNSDGFIVEINGEEHHFPSTVFETFEEIRRFHSGVEVKLVERVEDKYFSRLSAPGYLDCTEWCCYDTNEEAYDALESLYGLCPDEDEY